MAQIDRMMQKRLDGMNSVGRLWYDRKGDVWCMDCEPHVAMMAKRVFESVPKAGGGQFEFSNRPSICRDLQWFLERYPIQCDNPDELDYGAQAHIDHIQRMEDLLEGTAPLPTFDLEIPPREYQAQAAAAWIQQGYLLLADTVGLGKTCTAIAGLSHACTRPGLIVCAPHLQRQWKEEFKKFAPNLRIHIIKSMKLYPLPESRDGRKPDIFIISYRKLATDWAGVFGGMCNSVVYDEVQELRRCESQKWRAAHNVTASCNYAMGMSATPIYNYGGEFYNVLSCIRGGLLGNKEEFTREWCYSDQRESKVRLKDPDAFGSWLRENRIMIRRTRKDVGRELPPLTIVTHHVDSDGERIKAIEGEAAELARIVLNKAAPALARGEAMSAAGQFNTLMRQVTGIAKAPYVAAFVEMLLETGEPIILFGWHHAVYRIWLSKLDKYDPAIYTGRETESQKQKAARKFISGDTNLFIMSLRSGVGLDGLQARCRTAVYGEFDWSPAVHNQGIGRILRDGQKDPVMVYYMASDSGADPLMLEALGVKRDQLEGVIELRDDRELFEEIDDGGDRIAEMARQFLEKVDRKNGRNNR